MIAVDSGGFEFPDLQIDDVEFRLLITAILVILLLLTRWIVARVLRRRVDDVEIRHRARRAVTYVVTILLIAGLATIWVEPLRGLAAFFGLLSAGIAIALSDLLKNFAGWAFILSRRPFRRGDRVVIGDHMGDVLDIRLFSFTLLEVGAYVDAMQSTGRIINVPNGKVLTEPIINSSEGFAFAWHEIPVLITFESDWRRAEQHLLEVLEADCADTVEEARAAIARATDDLPIRYRSLTPTVYLTVRDSGVLLTGRMLVPVRQRRSREQNIWRGMLDRIAADPTVELAYPTLRAVHSGQPVAVGSHAPPPATPEPMPETEEDIEIVPVEPAGEED
ncbi:MAG: mechanosensitive ion channel [Nitriliruptorales bacterium]|nr:mechanosensitive ion channel [Nitriliruptorales bacterium]